MMCVNAKEWMAAAWRGELDEAAESQLKRHLAGCAECSAEMAELGALWERLGDLPAPEPSMAQHVRWQAALEAISRMEPGARTDVAALHGSGHSTAWGSNAWKFSLNALWPRRPVWQASIAASCLIAGLAIGGFWQHEKRDEGQIAALHSEIEATRELAALSLLRQQSATDRLRGVDYSQRMPTLEPRVVSALIEAVNRDSNVNVRLAAIDALARAADDAKVRQSLTASLPRQDSPMVQAALIDYLVDSRDAAVAPVLREFSSRVGLNESVRQHAELGARRLTEYR